MSSSIQPETPDGHSSPWLYFEQPEETESLITGNTEGLVALRDAIDQALHDGETRTEIPGLEQVTVRCAGSVPEPVSDPGNSQSMLYGCLAILVMFLMFAVIGVWYVAKAVISDFTGA